MMFVGEKVGATALTRMPSFFRSDIDRVKCMTPDAVRREREVRVIQ
jgi:hypothetical protein